MKIKGKSSTYEYLAWFDEYQYIQQKMKDLNKMILDYENQVDKEYKPTISKFRRELIRCRRSFCKADIILNEIYLRKRETDDKS